jgi:hypothetical protein
MEMNSENEQPSGHYEGTELLLPTCNRVALRDIVALVEYS